MIVNFPHCEELPEHFGGDIQLRSEETGLHYVDTLIKAVKLASEDMTIWKISYQTEFGWKRFVLR